MREPQTLNHLWMNSCAMYGSNIVFARHEHDLDAEDACDREVLYYKTFTYEEIERRIVEIGAALAYIGLREFDKVAILSESSTRMMITDFAVLGNRASNIPIATGISPEELKKILSDLQCCLVVVDNEERLEKFHDAIDSVESVHAIVVLSQEYCSPPTGEKKIVFAFDHLLQIGEESKCLHIFHNRRESTEPEDLATVMYTSGTTGLSKGVPLTHRNILSNVTAAGTLTTIEEEDKFLSILPSWNSFERTLEYIVLYCGASIWYAERNSFGHDMLDIKPSYMATVPKIWISMYNSIKQKLRKTGRDKLFNRLFKRSQRVIRDKRSREGRYIQRDGQKEQRKRATTLDHLFHFLADIFFYAHLRRKIGGHLKAGISGGGHLPDYIDDFFEVLNIPLLEGYGLTEAAPIVSVRTFDHNIPHTAGQPIPGTQLLFLDKNGIEVPPTEGGIIHIRGPQVIEGYFDGDRLDRGRFYTDMDGKRWLNTTDVGYLTDSGDLVIQGRSSELIELSNHRIITPESVEAALLRSSLINQVVICKASDSDRLFALIVPDDKALKSHCKRRLIPYSPERENRRILRIYEKKLESLLHIAHMHELSIAGVALVAPFTTETDTLTLTYKYKRKNIQQRERETLKRLEKETRSLP